MIEPQNLFREFAIDVYDGAGVSPAAVLLQDRCGVDVNVLLLAAFVGAAMGARFGSAEVEGARACSDRWQLEVVRPLRSLRTRLKDGPPPAPNPATAKLRTQIKAAELDAEMIELDQLAGFVGRLDLSAAPGDAVERATAAMLAVARDAANQEPERDERDAIATIAAAAARFGKE